MYHSYGIHEPVNFLGLQLSAKAAWHRTDRSVCHLAVHWIHRKSVCRIDIIIINSLLQDEIVFW